MNDRSMAIAILCSHLCVGENVFPLEPKEYSGLASVLAGKKLSPEDLLPFSKQDFMDRLDLTEEQAVRLLRLLDRGASLGFEISKYESMGISLLTRADPDYPKKLKKKLKNACPPLFYSAGERSLLDLPAVGYVGSRSIGEKDMEFTRSTVKKTVSNGYSVVSGGAKGCDSVAEEEALASGGAAIAFLSDSMLRKLKKAQTIQAVQQGRLLLLSVVKPDAGFNAGVAMMRNKYVYAQSEATLVIKSDYNKGGTWSGATENLKNQWSISLCWNHTSYPGNKALIERGAAPIGEDWDGNIEPFISKSEEEKTQQLSIFDQP